MKKYKLICSAVVLLVCLTFPAFGQDGLKSINGKIIDFKTKEPIGFVIVQVLFENSSTLSTLNGSFKIDYSGKTAIITIRKLGYETLTINVDSTLKLPLLVNLKAKSKDLSEVIISADKPTKRLVDNTFYVADYQLIDDAIVLLGDMNEVQYLRLITKAGDIVQTRKLSRRNYKGMLKDCFGNVHIQSAFSSTQIYVTGNTIELMDAIRLSLFDSVLRPCILNKENNFYFEDSYNDGQTKHVFGINKETKQHYDLGTYTNEDMLDMIQEQKSKDAMSGNAGKNEMEDLTPDELRDMRREEDKRNFFYTIVATDAYIPVFAGNDTIYIFDHPHNLIHSYLVDNNKSMPIKTMEYNHFRHWKPMVLFDEARNVFYTTYLSDGIITIGEINRTTGKISKRFKISGHTFPKNIKIDNGIVYYMYRVKFTDDKMALYAHQLE